MPNTAKQKKSSNKSESGLLSVLGEAVRRLTSQPLVFGVAVLLILVIAAGWSTDKLVALRTPAIIILVVGLVAWLLVELPKARAAANRKAPRQESITGGVNVEASDVGKGGEVVGIEGLPQNKALPGVKVRAEDVEGRVAGVSYAKRENEKDEQSGS